MSAQDSHSELPAARRFWLMTVASAAIAVVVGSMSALYTCLSDIALDAGASQSQLTWIVDAYTLALAALVLAGGAVGDRIGRRRALVLGMALFSVASLVPLVSGTPESLIAARACAGVGAALVMPSTLSLLTASVGDDRRSRAVGIWAGVAGAGSVIGIVASGLMLERWSWTSVFVLFTAAGTTILLASLTIPESRSAVRHRFDSAGAVLSAAAVGGLVTSLIEGPHRGWGDVLVVVGFVGSALAAVAFVLVETRTAHPLLDVRYFRRRGFAAGSLIVLLQFLVTFGVFLLIVQYLQLVRGYDPLGSALALAPMAVPMVLLGALAPTVATRTGLRLVVFVGMALMGVGLMWFSRLGTDWTYSQVLWPMLVMSTGIGLSSPPATAAIVSDVPADEHGVAAAVNDATREIGAAIGIAVAGSTVAHRYTDGIGPKLADLASGLPLPAHEAVTKSLAGALEVAAQAGPGGDSLAATARAVYTDGVGGALVVLGGIGLAGLVVLLVMTPGRGYVPLGDRGRGAADGVAGGKGADGPSGAHAAGVGVDGGPVAAAETDERDPGVVRQLGGQ